MKHYVLRAPDSEVPRPVITHTKRRESLIDDDFSEEDLLARRLSAETWNFEGGIATATHVTPPGEKRKKHGPKASYEAEFTNGKITFLVKPVNADAVVLTIDSAPATHVFRVRTVAEGAAERSLCEGQTVKSLKVAPSSFRGQRHLELGSKN